jgi:diguanylate cyclase (GGDEF)-like protein
MDLPTLWYLTFGTLLLSAAWTIWERKVHPKRAHELAILTTACCVLAIGCLIGMNRELLPGATGAALTNVVMIFGYLLVLHTVRALDGLKVSAGIILAVLGATGAVWTIAGAGWAIFLWNHLSAAPIAIISGLTAIAIYRSSMARAARSHPIAIAVFALHSAFYTARAFVVPLVVEQVGTEILPYVAKATMYEAVLFAVAMPISLLALVREERQAQLLAASQTDFLTGLHNRQGFFELGPALIGQFSSGTHSLLAFDLDHFKAINDRYGHQAGDRVLKIFAKAAIDVAGPRAMGVRLGGEEFAILLPNANGSVAALIGQEVARAFTREVANAGEITTLATVSIGLAESNSAEVDLAALLASADKALYQAKNLGRNRMEVAPRISDAA